MSDPQLYLCLWPCSPWHQRYWTTLFQT